MFFQRKSEITIKGEEQRTQYVLFTSIQQFGYAAKTSLSICGINESKLDIDGMGRWVDRDVTNGNGKTTEKNGNAICTRNWINLLLTLF
mmetsp:Transcript_33181/g.78385  ORF Transcript_33181/g.78385 Transcript_33181/m.78385 type:complete len:89 (+) Transcript_33181:743-1009(+)